MALSRTFIHPENHHIYHYDVITNTVTVIAPDRSEVSEKLTPSLRSRLDYHGIPSVLTRPYKGIKCPLLET